MAREEEQEQLVSLIVQEPALSVSRDLMGDFWVSDSFPDLPATRTVRIMPCEKRDFSNGLKIDYMGFGVDRGDLVVKPLGSVAEIEVRRKFLRHPLGDVLKLTKLGINLFNLYKLCWPRYWSVFMQEPNNPDKLTHLRVKDNSVLGIDKSSRDESVRDTENIMGILDRDFKLKESEPLSCER